MDPLIGDDADIVHMLATDAGHVPQILVLLQQWRLNRSFPKPIKGTDLYYLPAVRSWLEATYGLPTTAAACNFTVGEGENWDEPKTRKTRRPAHAGPGVAANQNRVDGAVAGLGQVDQGKPEVPEGHQSVVRLRPDA